MRTVCLWFPRLGVQLASRQRPALAGRTVVLIAGHGDDALVTETTCDAAVLGVLRGMSAGQARGRSPGAVFLPDNAGHCLDELERIASIIQTRATDPVAIGGRDHILIQADPAVPEAALAARLAALATAWSGLATRAGLADTASEALDAARASRGRPVVCPPQGGGETVVPYRPESITARSRVAIGSGELAIRATLQSLLTKAQAILEARGQGYRGVEIAITGGDGAITRTRLTPQSPAHDTAGIAPLAVRTLPPGALTGARSLEVTLDRLGPDVRVQPCRASLRIDRAAAGTLRRAG